MTLVQIAENPITVAIDDAINSLADNRQGRRPESVLNQPFPAKSFLTDALCRPNSIVRSKPFRYAAGYVVAVLNGDSDMIIS
jgi:hypothetical protein